MKLSTKGRYGLRAMYFLGKVERENILTLKELSKFTEVSPPYLEKVLGILRRKNLILAIRGVNGGYKLSRDPKEISIGEILRVLEGNLYLADCNAGACSRTNGCPNKNIFNNIYKKINNLLDTISLYDMILGEEYEK